MYEILKKQIDFTNINVLVSMRNDIKAKFDWASENADPEEFSEMLNFYDFITDKIADYYIQKYH